MEAFGIFSLSGIIFFFSFVLVLLLLFLNKRVLSIFFSLFSIVRRSNFAGAYAFL